MSEFYSDLLVLTIVLWPGGYLIFGSWEIGKPSIVYCIRIHNEAFRRPSKTTCTYFLIFYWYLAEEPEEQLRWRRI